MGSLKRITYVEDEPDIRAVAKLALENIGGFAIDSCSSGTEALERVPAFQPDLILLDVMMPEMNGEETFRRLKQMPALAHIPVVFMTAKAQTHEVEHYRSLGVSEVIAKPFDPVTLSDQLSAIWKRLQTGGIQAPCRIS